MMITIPVWLFVILCVLLLPYVLLACAVCLYIILGIIDVTRANKVLETKEETKNE